MCAIAEGIASSGFYVIDLSEQNCNVYMELGMMLARCEMDVRRRYVLISSFHEPLKGDIASVNVVKYEWDDLESFQKRLEATCLKTFERAAPAPLTATLPPPPAQQAGFAVQPARSGLVAAAPRFAEGGVSTLPPGVLYRPVAKNSVQVGDLDLDRIARLLRPNT
jgi:hypothetical protein